jgi:DNA-binding transcriptional MerR regulator
MDKDELLLTSEVGKILKISPDWVRGLERTGRLPALKTPGGVRLFKRCDVERLAREREARRRPTCNGDSLAPAVA